jgi:murein DD-endopeptidase MepM/ murein hydrolase activator NlpD
VTYVVERGDTLHSIAAKFDTTVESIAAANDIQNPALIVAGQKLVIPTIEVEPAPVLESLPPKRVHRVVRGETLPALAFRYRTTTFALIAANDLSMLGLLIPGMLLEIPPPAYVTSAAPRFPSIEVDAEEIVQGSTVVVEVESEAELELSGHFLERSLAFSGDDGSYWALVGVGALAQPGRYALSLEARETGSGDLLTMQEVFTVTAGSFSRYNVVVPEGRTNLLNASVTRTERQVVNEVFGGPATGQAWAGPFSLPLAGDPRVTAPFGQRRSYNGGPVTSYHSGLDLGADKGVPVTAPVTGTVVLAEELEVRGNAVIIDHGLGVMTGFWHLSQIDVEAGHEVGTGELVGLVGSTGLSTGPHLHWEMRVGGVPVDPMQWTRRAFP